MSMLVNEFEWLIQLADESLSITLFPNNSRSLVLNKERFPFVGFSSVSRYVCGKILRTIEPLLNFCRRQKIFLEDVTYQ